MPKVKYIAAGFLEDAEKVIGEFVSRNSPDFSDFRDIWKKHNFVAVFMCRSSEELVQFTQEIFHLTLKIVETTKHLHQIGAVYLLYSLFRAQPDPKHMIRITRKQYDLLKEMKELARTEKNLTLHFVISYLEEREAFAFVASNTLQGPLHGKPEKEVDTMPIKVDSIIKNAKDDSKSFFEDNALKEIEEIAGSYAESTKSMTFLTSKETYPDFKEKLKRLREEYRLLIFGGNDSAANGQSNEEQDNIGSRRAEIKSKAFAAKALFKHFNPTDEDLDDECERVTRSRAESDSLVKSDELSKETTTEDDREYVEKGAKPKKHKKPCKKKRRRKGGKRKKEVNEAELLEKALKEIPELHEEPKLKGRRRRGPLSKRSYIDGFTEEYLNETSDKFVSLLANAEDSDHEDIDDSDKEDSEAVDDPDELK